MVGGECPENTPGCICRKVRRLYETDKLRLYRGTVSRQQLMRSLGLPLHSLNSSSKNRLYEQARRCIANFDKYLYSLGHGTAWEEKIPEIEPYLESLQKANALPVNSNGNLNRTAILKKFDLGTSSMSVVLRRAPRLKDLLDRYDITAKDPAYPRYKYSKYKEKLKLLLEVNRPGFAGDSIS